MYFVHTITARCFKSKDRRAICILYADCIQHAERCCKSKGGDSSSLETISVVDEMCKLCFPLVALYKPRTTGIGLSGPEEPLLERLDSEEDVLSDARDISSDDENTDADDPENVELDIS